MKYAKGIMWLDDCRIPFVDEGDIKSATPNSLNATGEHSLFGFKSGNELDTKGRFTPNLLVCDDMLNDGIITSQSSRKYNNKVGGQMFYGLGENYAVGDKGSSSRYYNLDLWFNKMVDEL